MCVPAVWLVVSAVAGRAVVVAGHGVIVVGRSDSARKPPPRPCCVSKGETGAVVVCDAVPMGNRMHADLDFELRVYRGQQQLASVPVGALVSAETYPGDGGERYVRVEAVVEPSPLTFSMRAPHADSLADEINRAVASRVR